MNEVDSVIVSFSKNPDDPEKDLLVVGRKHLGVPTPEIINAVQGEDARRIYETLVEKNGGD